MKDLVEIYAGKVAKGELVEDSAQVAVMPEFERIRAIVEKQGKWRLFHFAAVPPKGLYLWGGVGRGKSMIMDMFVASLDVPVRRVHFHAFMQEMHAGMHAARKTGVQDAIAPVAASVAASVRVLAFDEMQINDITDAMIVGRLFEALFRAGVVVIATSNRPPDDLYKDGLNRQLFLPFIEMLKDKMVVWEMSSPHDYRQGLLAGAPVYFTPIGARARASLHAVWVDLAGAGAAEPLMLHVNGREVAIPAFRNGVARATFFDLCGQPLGPADYLALASAIRVLVLEDIPQLGRGNFNEAKRFVTLIDALYEARVRLVCSAAAQPEMLYIEGEGSFEFDRTASRLREMQGVDWGA